MKPSKEVTDFFTWMHTGHHGSCGKKVDQLRLPECFVDFLNGEAKTLRESTTPPLPAIVEFKDKSTAEGFDRFKGLTAIRGRFALPEEGDRYFGGLFASVVKCVCSNLMDTLLCEPRLGLRPCQITTKMVLCRRDEITRKPYVQYEFLVVTAHRDAFLAAA